MNKLRKPQSDFTIIPNALLRDDRLSLKAKGLYALLFSKPDEWVYIEEVLVRESWDGRDAFRAGIYELAVHGWLRKEQVRVDGVFSHTEIWLHNAPVDGKPVDGLSVDGKSDANNTDLSKTDSLSVSATPKPTKASKRADPVRSIAILLEDLVTIPGYYRLEAERKFGFSLDKIHDEWAKFRNHHISARSKHTRIDLCWDTWCRRAAEWSGGSGKAAGGKPGQGGYKRHDIMAAATATALADLYGIGTEGHAGASPAADASPCPFGDGQATAEAGFVDVGPGSAILGEAAGGAGGGSEDSDAGAAVPHPVK